MAGVPVETPDVLLLAFQLQQQPNLDSTSLDPGIGLTLLWSRRTAVCKLPLIFSFFRLGLSRLLGCTLQNCNIAEDRDILHGVTFAAG